MGFKDECGVFGVWDHKDAAYLTYLGLYALQHRGQESAGIVSSNGREFVTHKGLGEVNDVFKGDVMAPLKGRCAVGHVRYSTQGASALKNAQPVVVDCWRGPIALAHNGNLVNAMEVREALGREGSIFQTDSDSEVILHLVSRSRKTHFVDALVDALTQFKGAYSLVVLTKKALYAVRDPYGVRPLTLGRLDGSYVVASESCAFDLIGAETVRELDPGEVLIIDHEGVRTERPFATVTPRPCVFEHVYFARPDSRIFGRNVSIARQAFGRRLAREAPAEADLVVPVPDSGVPAAFGYSKESGIPLEMAIIRNHYVGRTFISPGQGFRNFGIKVKLNPASEIIKGQRLVVIDDSIVRGNTSRKLVQILRSAGAKEIHLRISSPPTTHPCFYGIDTPTREELIASHKSVEEIAKYLGVDSLRYLSLEGMLEAARAVDGQTFCSACFDGDYKVDFAQVRMAQTALTLTGE